MPSPAVLQPTLAVGGMTFQSVGTVNDTLLIRSSPVPVSVTLTFCKKATAVSSAVDTSPAATSPATGVTRRFSTTVLLSVGGASCVSASGTPSRVGLPAANASGIVELST